MSKRLLGCVVVPACCVLAVGSPLAAASPAHDAARARSGSAPLTMRKGDEITVTGSRLRCAVSTASGASHPPTLVCGIGDIQSPLPGTYAFAIADTGAIVIKSSPTRQPLLVAREGEPTPPTPLFPAAAKRAATTLKVGVGALLLVGGSDILCSVSSQSDTPTLTCGLAAGGSGTFLVGSYVGVISQRVAVLTRLLTKTSFHTVFSEPQPAS